MSPAQREGAVLCFKRFLKQLVLTGDTDVYFYLQGMVDMARHTDDKELMEEMTEACRGVRIPIPPSTEGMN